MSSSGYTPISFTAGEQPTSAKWNLIGSNDASFNTGNGFNDGIIVTRHVGSSQITSDKLGTGLLVGFGYTSISALATGTTTIPNDDTIPQNTEGNQYMSLSYTPALATNILEVSVSLDVSHSSSVAYIITSLFQDSNVNALFTLPSTNPTGTAPSPVSFTYAFIAGTASSTVLSVRSGSSNAGTTTVNGQNGIRHFGTTPKSSITVREYKV